MDKCYYYLSNGLWKIAEQYLDPNDDVQREYFFGMAVAPNQYSFRSRIIATPWQQSWVTINILKNANINFITHTNEKSEPIDLNNLQKEIDFQYTLRNYISDSFVQDLFNIYSKIQTHISINFSEAELKTFNSKFKILLKILLKECPSTAHTLFRQMLEEQFFVNSCQTLFYEVQDDSALCNLIFSSFCQNEMIQFHIPYVMGLLQSPFRKNLCLLLLAHDHISILHAMLEEDKKIFLSNSRKRLQSLMDNGIQPLQCFFDMTLMERHFLLQIFDMINAHLDELPLFINCDNIPFFVWPVILLQNWNNNSLSDEFLLQLIEKCKESTKDKAITQITYILEWCINFSKWYEKHENHENQENKVKIGNKQNLLEEAKDHSVLYLINNTTDLSETNWSQIKDLLSQGKSKSENKESWDLTLFDGYCILMQVLRAIVLSTEIDQLAKLQKVKVSDIIFFNEIFNSMYKDEVTELLKKVKEKLNFLYPLTFRLEILENIFALIFIKYEDVKDLSYFVKGCLNVEKYVEKVQMNDRSVPIEKSVNKLQRSFSSITQPVLLTDKSDEDNATKKQKFKGFMCKKYILRDLIYLVKECLEILEEDPGSHTKTGNSLIDVLCSITSGQMENRLDRLLESVSEATWRLQLVTGPEFISQESTMQYACGQDPFHHFEGEWVYLPHDLDKNSGLKIRKKSGEKRNDSGTQSNSSPGNEITTAESQITKRKISGPAVMNQMLACDSSLVVHCLSQGDILNADHIMQMMSTEENRQNLEGELNFTRAINDLKKKLQNIALESPVRKSGVESNSQSRSLQTIQIIANQGVTSTALTNQIERFLSAYTLPTIQSHSKVSAGSVLQCIENTTAMVIIDLALTLPMTFQEFRDLLNIASKHCPELSTRIQSPISAQSGSIKPLGYIVFSQNMIALLQEINRDREPESEISLQQFLRSHQYPFSLKALKDNLNFWKHLKIVFSDFEKNVEESKSLETCKEGLLAKCQKNIKETHNIFERITKLTENCNEFMNFGKQEAPTGEVIKSVNYCDLVSRYLTDLSAFVLENICSKTEELKKPITLHNLLEQSAVDIVDKLVFEYHIEPSVLEKKAQQLGFNLTASLIAGCCPKLLQNCETIENSVCPPCDRIVLNELITDYQYLLPLEPMKIVENILSELLIEFEEYLKIKGDKDHTSKSPRNLLVESDLSILRSNKKIQKILEKTHQIQFVELKKLKDLELVVFFINLLNLMMCHCYLSSKLLKTDGVFSKYIFYRDISFAFLGYNVGELGFLSVIDVKQKLLGDNLDTWISNESNETWSELFVTIPDPRLIFAAINFKFSSPPLVIFRYNDFEKQVIESVDKYVQTFVSIQEKKILISDLLDMYLNKVILREFSKNETQKTEIEKNKLILKFLVDHSSSKIQEQLNSFTVSDVTLDIISPHTELMLKLDHSITYVEKRLEEKISEKWLDRTLTDSILRHFSQNSRVLADIVYKIHEAKSNNPTEVGRDVLLEEKFKYLDHLLNASWLQKIAPLFNGNTVIAALSKYPEEQNVVDFFEKCVFKRDWFKCLDVIFAFPDYYVSSNLNVKRFKDLTLREATLLASKDGKENPWYYSQHISEVNIRLKTVFECCQFWPGNVSCVELSSILRDNPSLPLQQVDNIKNFIKKIKIYNTIVESTPSLEAKSWFDVCSIAKVTPDVIIKSLIKTNQLELCLKWCSLPGILNSIQQFIDSDFIVLVFEHLYQEVNLVDQLLESIPNSTLIKLYKEVLFQLTSFHAISNLVRKAKKIDPSPVYKMVEISLEFLSQLDSEEQSLLLHLISYPLLIIEQLLMNTKLEALEKVLKKAKEIEDEFINQDKINKLLVSYAVKAIEFNLVKPVKNSEKKQSFLIGSTSHINQDENIPSEVPDKCQWVPDNTVSLCMCCRLVTFSMFNRRHHCRRCGRVVCGACSVNRIKVDGYRGVAVRVCQNCFLHHTKSGTDMKCSQSTTTFESSNFTEDFYYWKLSIDESKNATLREEFSYEHSPDVTLCLAIFNLMSDYSYYSVLLEESEKMLKGLQLNGKAGNPEVDCGVVIQIIRSLILGAKVKYGHAGLISKIDYCDQLLSQVDILQLLVNNYCSSLIPSEPLNGTTLRCLRDKLMEEELWELAMEVSTKCGLDRNCVWASWGKVCLAAGSYDDARIKFSHCLTLSPKPFRNPPLVDEICRILETPIVNINVKSAQKQPEKEIVAQEVAQILSTLKFISQGKPLTTTVVSPKNSIQYEEEIFYLSSYGSHQALLTFYLKRNEFKSALTYLLKEQLEPEFFLEYLLLPSYETQRHENLKFDMLCVDPSLESFKKHLTYSCLYMQKVGYLHTLYDIQILMQDYLRAMVTCTLLYQKNAVNFTDLVSRSDYLYTAVKHLEEELFALNKKNKRLDCVMQMNTKTINHHMNTIWRQLEAAKFLAACEAKNNFTAKDLFPDEVSKENVLTLFDGNPERSVIVKMIVICGKNISEGFGIAFRIIQDHQLDIQSIFVEIGKKLAEEMRVDDIKALVDCLKTLDMPNITLIIDTMIASVIPILARNGAKTADLEALFKPIKNVNLKINAFIDTCQLVPAYILAVKHNRLSDVQRIMEVADQKGLTIIKKICQSKLNQSTECDSSEEFATLPNVDTS